MQDRYTGDIGDFSKLGLLRALRSAGLSVGLNWYLTPDETHNGDGRHVDYLDQDEYRVCDEGLWLGLRAIVKSGERKVRSMERDDILQATFFSDRLDFSDSEHAGRRHRSRAERVALREEWFGRSLTKLDGCNVVCVDPDNGLVVPAALGRPKENKYVLPEELAAYYARGSTVVYYQHKARRKDPFYVEQLEGLVGGCDFPGASGMALKFEKVSQRYYMLIVQPQHREAVDGAVRGMLSTAWGDYFRLLRA